MTAWNAWGAPSPRRTPTVSPALLGALIALLAAIVAVTAVGAVLIRQRDREPTDRPAVSPVPSSPIPSSPGSTSPPAGDPDATLDHNALYVQTMPDSDCAQPPRPLPTGPDAERRYLVDVIGCMTTAYAAPFAATEHTMTTPTVTVYRDQVQTPCGSAKPGYPVFYCPANEGVYASSGSMATYGEAMRLAGYWMVFHEFAHHVQQRIGVLDAAYSRDEDRNQISRRVELQADCYMGITSHTIRSTKLNGTDRDELRRWREAAADATHGSTASQLHWVLRGFDSRDLDRCTTWTVSRDID